VFSIFGAILSWVLSRFFGKAGEPSASAVAASNATAMTELKQEQAANEITNKASAARATADAAVVRVLADKHPDDASTVADLKKQFPDDFR
jgi:hypothetical protein